MDIGKIVSKKNRALLRELVATDFKLRYQGSVLGYAWSLLRPLLLFLILYVVFVKLLGLNKGIDHYPVYLLLGIVLWTFFADMTSMSLGSIVGRSELIRKIRIPRWIIVLSSSVSALINLGLNLVIVVLFMFINHVDIMRTIVWLPLIFAEVYLFAIGVSLFLSAAFVKFRDVSYIWEVVLQAAFYLTPILYSLTRITNVTFQKILLVNPMAQTIQDARYAGITHQTITISSAYGTHFALFIPVGVVIAVFLGGLLYFKRQAPFFAENI